MRAALVALTILCASCSPTPERPAEPGKPATYLASITLPLNPDERLESFGFDTWGVRILAICHIPPGWRIKGGGSVAPDGEIIGEGSHGVTWLKDMKPLENLVLVRLDGPVREADQGAVPATFKGKAILEGDDASREAVLTHANVRLTPAAGCP